VPIWLVPAIAGATFGFVARGGTEDIANTVKWSVIAGIVFLLYKRFAA